MLEHVTFTGIDERADLERVAAIGRRHPWAEFAVLAGSASGETPRFPSLRVVERLRRLREAEATHTAIHLCGRLSRAVRDGRYETAAALCAGFGRAQVNLPAADRAAAIDNCAELSLRTGTRVIVQHEGPWPVPDTWRPKGIDRLQDRSGGAGLETIDEWPPPAAGGQGGTATPAGSARGTSRPRSTSPHGSTGSGCGSTEGRARPRRLARPRRRRGGVRRSRAAGRARAAAGPGGDR